jgi:hypothetical protein
MINKENYTSQLMCEGCGKLSSKCDCKRDMKIFFWKMFAFQTVFYGLLAFMGYTDAMTDDGKFLWIPFTLTFYLISILITFVIPMIKIYKDKL